MDDPSGRCVWVWAGEKSRPGVVLRLNNQGRAVILWGTKTERAQLAHVRVDPKTPQGHALGLSVPTYFYTGNLVTVDPTTLRVGGHCPLPLLLGLRRLVG